MPRSRRKHSRRGSKSSGRNRKLRRIRTVERLEDRIVLDAGGPVVLLHTPTEIRNDTFDHIDISFDLSIDASSFSSEDVSIEGPGGAVNVIGVDPLSETSFRINFEALATRGNYEAEIGPNISDTSGNLLDQDQDGIAGEVLDDVYEASFVFIQSDVILASNLTIGEGDTTFDNQDVLIDGATIAIDGLHAFNSIHVVNGGIVTHSANTTSGTHKIEVSITEQLIVDSTSRVDVSGKGYLPGYTTGNTTVGGATHTAGGSYGGRGGGSTTNLVYGDYADPNDWGSGGHVLSGFHRAGGGLVRITADVFHLDGNLVAHGGNAPNGYSGAGGSGGGIYVSVGELDGAGSIDASGGVGDNASGGGGRVAVYATDFADFDIDKVTALGGDRSRDGGAGTVYIRDTDELSGTLIIDGSSGGSGVTPLGLPGQSTFTIPDAVVIRGRETYVSPEHAGLELDFQNALTITDKGLLVMPEDLTLDSTATLIVSNEGKLRVVQDLTIDGTLTLTDSGLIEIEGKLDSSQALTVSGGTLAAGKLVAPAVSIEDGGVLTSLTSTATKMHKLEIAVDGTLSVDASSRIDVSEKGYLPGYTTGNTTVGGATHTAGGSYGGRGGGSTTNLVYGDYADPNDWGSGGQALGSSSRRAGGGLVRITAETLSLDGNVAANGGLASGVHAAGSGGGIYIAVDTITGSGSIMASGGTGSNASGGGGRVAVYATDFADFDLDKVTALGGDRSRDGGAGTVYIRDTDESSGTLIIDASTGGAGVTPLGLPGQTTFTIPDAVVIRGQETSVIPEHAGLELDFQNTLTITERGRLTVSDNLDLNSELILHNQGSLQVAKSLVSSIPLNISGGTIATSRLVAPELSITGGGVLTSLTSTTSQMHGLEVNVDGTLLLDASSRIDVSGKGYRAGYTTGNTTVGAATSRGGGSYGGLGASNQGTTNDLYGDFADPEDWGSGGGTAPGGGLVRITADELVLDGSISANGAAGAGAGSGGSVFVSVDTLSGQGTIQAAGGIENTNAVGSGGGGGRVAVYADDISSFDLQEITVTGGTGNRNGAPGTVHISQEDLHTHVRLHAPTGVENVGFAGMGNGHINEAFDSITLTFNKQIDLASFQLSEIVIEGPLGYIASTAISSVGDRTYQIDFPAQSEDGVYHFTLLPTLLDEEGFELDQDADGTPGESEDSYTFTLTLDTVAPRIPQHTPAGDVTGTIDHIDVWFSEEIDNTTFTTSDVSIIAPNGQNVAVSNITEVGLNRFRIGFAPQTATGVYQTLIGPDVRDLAWNRLDIDQDGVFGEDGDDVYSARVNLVPVDLEVFDIAVDPAELVAGEQATISWQGQNATGVPLLGDWTDGVYVSEDDEWDISDILLTTVEHTGGLIVDEVYAQTVTANVPGVLAGDYFILVRSDIYNQEVEEYGEANNLSASQPIPVAIREIATNETGQTGQLTGEDRADYYALNVAGGENIGLILDGHSLTGANELYVSFEAIPTRLNYDLRAVRSERDVDGQDQHLAFTAPPGGGTFYVLVYGEDISGSTD